TGESADEGSPAVVGTLGAVAAAASAGILLDHAEGEDDSHSEALDFETEAQGEEAAAQPMADDLALDDAGAGEDVTTEIAVAELAPDDDATMEIAVADLAPQDAEDAPDTIAVADLAPDNAEDIAVVDLASDAVEAGSAEVQGGPDPLAAVAVGELAPDIEAVSGTDAPDTVEADTVDVGDLAPADDEVAASAEPGVPIAELAPDEAEDDGVTVHGVTDEDSVAVEALAPDEAGPEDIPFDFASADLSADASSAVDVPVEAEAAESWVEPVGEFLVQEAVQQDEPAEEGLSVSSVFRSLLDYEPLPASEELANGGAEAVADWNWSPVEVDEDGVQGGQEGGTTADAAEGASDEAPAAPAEGDSSPEDSEEPGPDDFQAWLERNSL
ncbi:MAG: hypothetical protein ACR2QM_04885, partial [Longimicrobiales bacterium]